jgi:SAM-dependent methyltransferase
MRLVSLLRRCLAHPLTSGMDLDDPSTTALRKRIIESKPSLLAIYDEWYSTLAAELPSAPGPVLELGSGAGYCERFIPGLITSELMACPGVRLAADGHRLPFAGASLRAIVFTDVLHHMPDVRQFFAEASRCLRPGGRILMIEPWVSGWSRFVYKRLHHEPFRPEAANWSFPSTGPLSGANGALPWIIFSRDRRQFESDFPDLEIKQVRPFLPFRYLLSGGVSMRSLTPEFTRSLWTRLESSLHGQMPRFAMFAFIALQRH